jgi:hypothetical protein
MTVVSANAAVQHPLFSDAIMSVRNMWFVLRLRVSGCVTKIISVATHCITLPRLA